MRGRAEDHEVQAGEQIDRRRGHVDDEGVDAPVSETAGHGPADLLGVAEHRLHDHESGGTTCEILCTCHGSRLARHVCRRQGCTSASRKALGPDRGGPFAPAAGPASAGCWP